VKRSRASPDRRSCTRSTATHIDLYDREEFVPQAMAKLKAFFGEYLVTFAKPSQAA
jgi:hypothetical protein